MKNLVRTLILLALVGQVACGSKKKKEETPAPVVPSAEASGSTPAIVPASPGSETTNTIELAPLPTGEALASSPTPTTTAPSGIPWSYQGEAGPAFWSTVDPLFALCGNGKKQSPVDLVWRKPGKGQKVDFKYKEEPLSILDNGYTVQINFAPGQVAVLNGKTYELNYLQFRTSSEHTISGNELPLEIQLFHADKKGKTAIVSIIVIEGPASPVLEKFWGKLPKQKFQPETHADVIFNPLELLPPALTYYSYTGSLTTPPCTEGINWFVLNTPVTASADQILAFRKLYSSNKRPLQPLNGRKVQNF